MRNDIAAVFVLLALAGCGGGKVQPQDDAGTTLPTARCLDGDGDGIPGTGMCGEEPVIDCNDADPLAYPGADERCNDQDDDCDGEVDEGLPVSGYFRDADEDGYGGTQVGEGCAAPPEGTVTQSGDCNDSDPAANPGVTEVCNDVDDDCDGTADDGLTFRDYYTDADGDGAGDPMSTPVNSCQGALTGKAPNDADCDDANPTIKPGATELCNKVDDNCDGQVDNGIAFSDYYPDVDGDGFGSATASPESACAPVPGKVTNAQDCNDNAPQVKPGAPELCNGQDDDCNSLVDDGLTFANYYVDVDGDGYGAAGTSPQSSCQPIAGRATNDGDCNDSNAQVKPGAPEVCNGVDDNCSGSADEGLTFTPYFADGDGDGYGAGTAINACSPIAGRVSNNTDCNDGNGAVHPGATEVCNGVDDDCAGGVDNGLTFTNYYPDADGDGFGSATATAQSSCTAVAGKVTNNQDCDDSRFTVKPGATEVCNGLDDDCAGGVDDGLTFTNYYVDADADGHGRQGSTPISACAPVSGRVTSSDDCNDAVATTYTGAPELCNGVDDNCNTLVDDGVTTQNYYSDVDSDGFGAVGSSPQASCAPVSGKVTNNTDCNDNNSAVKPGAAEVCNGVDDNCVGGVDEGLTFLNYYPDVDSDGYGSATASPQSACAAVAGKVTNNQDCNDNNSSIKPGATEVCNGVDDNCAGGVDEGLPTQSYYTDGDSDGFGAQGSGAVQSCGPVAGRVTNNTDCNDGNPAVRPNANEACNNVDDNCNSQVDEGNPGGGGSCTTGQSGVCSPGTVTCQAGALACVRNVNPSAEKCNALDDDCDGSTDEDWPTRGQACTAGLGVCLRSGTYVCNGAQTGVQCSVTAGSPTAAACDGLDNDCDGTVDEPVLSSTSDLTSTAWRDLEVAPYYYSSASCAGGVNGSGSDALAGGALAMSVGTSGISFQRLTTAGAPTGGLTTVTSLTYSDIAMAQAGDGFLIAGIWSYNNAEIDVYYVDASTGVQRTYAYTLFNTGNTLDSIRLVRGNGKRVTLLWREAGVGLKLARLEPCYTTSWSIAGAGCGALTSSTLVANTAALPGLGADSSHLDWVSSQSCPSAASLRQLGVAYVPTATSVNFFTVSEDGSGKSAETVARSVSSPRTLNEPEVTNFRDASAVDQYFVAYVTKDSGSTEADLNFWMTNAQSWHYAWLAYADQNGADSIFHPRASFTGSELWLTAERYEDDPSTYFRQVMTRRIDQAGNKVPSSSAVETVATTGSCADAACRPGDKYGFTSWAAKGRVYFAGTGSSPAGTYASTLTCN